MSYIIQNASTNPYPKYHIGDTEEVACGIIKAHPNATFVEVDQAPKGYIPCRTCFRKEVGKSKKWKKVMPITEDFNAYGQTFVNKSVPVSQIKQISSQSKQLWPGGPEIIISYIKPAGSFWMFPSLESKNETMNYVKKLLNQQS